MKRKIAVFSNAWSEKSLSDALEGIKERAQEEDFDIFVFLSHAAPGNDANEQREEKRIYQLPDLEDFDGGIIFSSAMNFHDLVEDIWQRARKAGVPLVSIGEKLEGCPLVEFNNKDSMKQLVEHLITVHGIKDIEFIAGMKDSVDSNIRIEAAREVMQKYNLVLDEPNLHYGDWSVFGAMKTTADIIESREGKLPDAFICANDTLAMSVCVELENHGFHVPNDTVVTGYDRIYDGQIFDPSLCTVGRDDKLSGKMAFDSLLLAIQEQKNEDIIIDSEFIPNQSCGCVNSNANKLRSDECKRAFYNKVDSLNFGWSNSWLSSRVLDSKNPKDIRNNLEEHFKNSHMFKNGTAFILEDPIAKMYFAGNVTNDFENISYSEELEVMVAVDHFNVIDKSNTMPRKQMIPGYKKIENNSRLFIFLPIHFKDRVFGYAVIEDFVEGIANRKIKIFVDSFNQTIDKLKQNIALEQLNARLQELYTKDALTGMYNRFGFATIGNLMYENCREHENEMILMFTDINRMKLINDYYGHLQGDKAIKTTAEAILESIPEDWIAIRFGGDEFLIMGQSNHADNIDAVKNKIVNEVKNKGKEAQYPFYLSVSCGYLKFVPDSNKTLDSYIKQADEAMYEIKAYMHSCDQELRDFVEKCKGNTLE